MSVNLVKGLLKQLLSLLLALLYLINVSSGSGHSGEVTGGMENLSASDSSRIMTVVADPLSPSLNSHVHIAKGNKQQYSSSFYGSPGVPGSLSSAATDYYQAPSSPVQTSYNNQLDVVDYVIDNQRPGRQLGPLSSSLNPSNLLAMASGYSDSVTDYSGDNIASPGGGGGGGGWSYSQPSHGHGHHGGYFAKADCNSALGLLGVLGLVSFLQNVLRQMTTTTPKPGRRKRAAGHDDDSHLSAPGAHGSIQQVNNYNDNEDYTTELNRVTTLILPLLSAVAHARDGLVPFECTHRHICDANYKLTKQLGPRGRSLASTLTDAVADMLTKEPKHHMNVRMEFSKNYLQEKLIRAAGKIGRNGESCENYYKFCQQLQKLPTYTIPPSMLQNYY